MMFWKKKKPVEIKEFTRCNCVKCDNYLGDEVSIQNTKDWNYFIENGEYWENPIILHICVKCGKYEAYLEDIKKRREDKLKEKKEEKYKIKRDEETRLANIKYYKKRNAYINKRDKYLAKLEGEKNKKS